MAGKSLIDWLVRAVVDMRWRCVSIIIAQRVMIAVILESG